MERVKSLILFLEEEGFVFTQENSNKDDSQTVFSHSESCDLENCSVFDGKKQNKDMPDFNLIFNSCLSGPFIVCEILVFSFQTIKPCNREKTCLKFIQIAKSIDFFEKFIYQWPDESWFFCKYTKISRSKNIFVFSILEESQPSMFKTIFVSSDGIKVT